MFYALKATGNETARKLVEIFDELDEVEYQIEMLDAFEETDDGWQRLAA